MTWWVALVAVSALAWSCCSQLQLVELLLAPTGWSRVIASAAISGPVLLLLVLRMLKGGRHPRPPADLNDPGSESVL